MAGAPRWHSPTQNWNESQKGLLYALLCYVFWGLFPLYWLPLLGQGVGADQLLAQRIVWSSLLAVGLVCWQRQWPVLAAALRNPRVWRVFVFSSLVLAVNWLTYLWAVTNHHVLDASLGYFMSPLVTIALGRVFLKDRLPWLQWLAVGLATVGVLWLAILGGRIPWVALGLSISWGIYGLLRKNAPLGALPGLTLETLMLLPLALAYLAWAKIHGQLLFGALPWLPMLLIVGSGVVTTLPLLLFAAAARRISLASLGMIQYVSPTLQFIIGLWVFHETFDAVRFIGYVWVWGGVLLFAAASYARHRRSNTASAVVKE